MRVATVISLDVGVYSPILRLLELSDEEGIGVGISLDMLKEPGRQRFGDVVVVDTGGGVEILDEYGVVGASSGAHDSTLVDILDVTGLHGEPVDDDREVGYLPTVLFKPFGAFDGVGVLVCVEAMLEVLDCGLTAGFNGVEIGAMFGLLRCESFRKSTIPSCLGSGQGLIDALLGVVSFLSEGGDEVLVSVFVIDGVQPLL